jgi:hypothetical protein
MNKQKKNVSVRDLKPSKDARGGRHQHHRRHAESIPGGGGDVDSSGGGRGRRYPQ